MFISKKRFHEEIEKARIEGENRCFKHMEEHRFQNEIRRKLGSIEITLNKIEGTLSAEPIKLPEPLVFPDMKGVRHV